MARPIAVGPVNDTVFHRAFIDRPDRPNEFPKLFQEVEGLHDHRLLALVSALIIEERIDRLLGMFMPRYALLTELQDFGFSMKIKTLEALNLIPKHITEACHVVRAFRNEFAHNLSIKQFSQVKKDILRKMDGLLRRVDPVLFDSGTTEAAIYKNFRNTMWIASVSTELYMPNLDRLRAKLEDNGFIEQLGVDAQNDFNRRLAELKAKGPKSVRKHGEKWEYIYEGFHEISDVPPDQIKQHKKSQE